MNTTIKVTKPNFKDILKNISLNCTTIVTILVSIIVVLIPISFLPYIYNSTNQIRLTYFFTIIASLTILALKIYEIIKVKKEKKNTNKTRKNNNTFLSLCMSIYALLIIISAVSSRYFPYTLLHGAIGRFEGTLTLYLYLLLFYLAYKFFKWKDKFLPYIAASTMIVSGVGIVQAILYKILPNLSNHEYMAYSSFGNPNFFSSYLTLFLPIYMLVYLKKGNPFYLITSIVTFGALVCTKTLGGYVIFVIYLVIILIYAMCKKYKLKYIWLLLFSFACMFAVLNVCTKGIYVKEVISIDQEIEKAKSNDENVKNKFGSGRGYIYKISLNIIQKYPLLGIGPDSLGAYFMEHYYLEPGYSYKYLFDKAHSEYLQIAVCTGIPSLICYICIIATIGITMFKNFLKDTNNLSLFAVGISCLSYLIQASTNISVTHVAPMFWIMLGIGYGMCKKSSYDTEIGE